MPVSVGREAGGTSERLASSYGGDHDITQAYELIDGIESEYVIADYDSQRFRERIVATPVIPPRSSRREPQPYDEHLYGERHLVECYINKMKHYRHIFSRFDKLATGMYLGFLHFVGALDMAEMKCQHTLDCVDNSHLLPVTPSEAKKLRSVNGVCATILDSSLRCAAFRMTV